MPQFSPLTPIYTKKKRVGATIVGPSLGEPVDPPTPEPPTDALIEQDFRDLPSAPTGWTDDGTVVYDVNGARGSVDNDHAELTYTWTHGVITAGTIAYITTQNETLHGDTYAIIEDPGVGYAYVNAEGPAVASAGRETAMPQVGHAILTDPMTLSVARWDDTAGLASVDLYDTNEPDEYDDATYTPNAGFTPDNLIIAIWRDIGVREAVAVYVYVWDRVLTDGEIYSLADSWGLTYNPPPPTPGDLLVGAAVVPTSGQSWTQATAAFETLIGEGITIARRFTSGKPGLWSSKAQFTVDDGIRDSAVSFKGPITQAEIEDFLDSIPDTGFTRYVSLHHEPENDGGTHDEAWFKGEQDKLMDAYIAVGSPAHVRLMVTYMFYLEHDGNGATSTADWFPNGDLSDWVMGLDPYDVNGVRSMEYLVDPTLTLWRAAGGVDFMICETGTQDMILDGDAAGVAWVEAACDWLRAEGCIGVCWWNASKAYDWRMNSFPLTAAAWGAEVTA